MNRQTLCLAAIFVLLIAPAIAGSPIAPDSTYPQINYTGDNFDQGYAVKGFIPQKFFHVRSEIIIPQDAQLPQPPQAAAPEPQPKAAQGAILIALYPGGETFNSGASRRSLSSRGRARPRYLDISPIIRKYSEQYSLSPHLVKAVIQVESGYWNYAVSCSGAQGLMQLMPSTASILGCKNSFEPEENIKAGCKYLRELMNMFGDLTLVVAAYNAGPGMVRRSGGVPPRYQTIHYVEKVMKAYRGYLAGQ